MIADTTAAYIHQTDFNLFKTAIYATQHIEGFHFIANISRPVLGQSGTGHFTPIGGLLKEVDRDDRVFLFDTARFKYPPHWVDLKLLYKSIYALRGDGVARGYIITTLKPTSQEKGKVLSRLPALPKCDMLSLFDEYVMTEGYKPEG